MGYLRFFLAVAVVVVHIGGVYGYRPLTGRVAVEIFFAISGYLMALVLTEKYEGGQVRAFFVSRVVRLYPSYLLSLVFAASVGVFLWEESSWMVHWRTHGSELGITQILFLILSQVLIVGSELPLFLKATDGSWDFVFSTIDTSVWRYQLVPPAWSLSLEVIFYCIAPLVVRATTRSLVACVTGMVLLKVFVLWELDGSRGPFEYRFFPFEVAFFVAGMLAYRFRELIFRTSNGAVVLVVLAALLPAFQFLNAGMREVGVSEEFPALAVVLFSTYALPHLAGPGGWNGRIESWLGQLSLPIYLLHWPVIELLRSLKLAGEMGPLVEFGGVMLVTTLVSLLSNQLAGWIGQPLRAVLMRSTMVGLLPMKRVSLKAVERFRYLRQR